MGAWGGAASGLLAQAPTPFSLTRSHHPGSPKAEVSQGERGSDRRWGVGLVEWASGARGQSRGSGPPLGGL